MFLRTLVFVSATLAHIIVLVPSGGEVVPSGTNTTVSWDPSTNPSNLTLAIILEQGDPTGSARVVKSLAAGGIANSGSFLWAVGSSIPYSSDYFVRVQTGADTDWTGGLGDNPPEPDGRFGTSGVFTINNANVITASPSSSSLNSSQTQSSNSLPSSSTASTTATSTSQYTPSSSLIPTPQPTQLPQNLTIPNDHPNITYSPPSSWIPAPAPQACAASPVERASRTVNSTIIFNFTGIAIYVRAFAEYNATYTVVVDNDPPVIGTNVSVSNPSCTYAFSRGGLDPRTSHSLIIEVIDDPNNNTSFEFDSLVVTSIDIGRDLPHSAATSFSYNLFLHLFAVGISICVLSL